MIGQSKAEGSILQYVPGVALTIGWLSLLMVIILESFPELILQVNSDWFSVSRLVSISLKQEAVVSLMVVGGCIRQAVSIVEDECDRIETERAAFQQFADEVADLNIRSQQTVDPSRTVIETKNSGEQLKSVRRRYQNTIMGVSHYDEDYGERIRENMATELSPELATAVLDGDQFSLHVQQLLIHQSQGGVKSREGLLETLHQEKESLIHSRTTLRETESIWERTKSSELDLQSFSELIDHERELRQTTVSCEQLLEARQREIHRMNRNYSRSNQSLLQQYLYENLDTNFPVLNETLDRIQQLMERQRTVTSAISRRC